MNTNHNRIKVADLETNEPDKILTTNSSGELEFSEINKFSELSNLITTIKPIVSTVLQAQNTIGFVNYINSLNPILTVGPNEIVKYTTTDSGRVFQINLRGRSFGIGQSPITVSDVIEITAFLNKDIKLSNYPSIRNDGNLTNNKVLSTDVNGNLKMYTFTNYPAPYISDASLFFLPSSTGNLTIKGAFFTPSMTVTITGHTVNYLTFVSDNEIIVNITTSANEGSFDITLNNGISTVFSGRLLVVLGIIHKPGISDWTVINGSPNLNTTGDIKLSLYDVTCSATCFTIPSDKDFRVYFTLTRSPLGATSGSPNEPSISLISASDNSVKFAAQVYLNGADVTSNLRAYQASSGFEYSKDIGILESFIIKTNPPTFYFERIGGQYRLRDYNTNIVFTDIFSGDLKIKANIRKFDITNIRYVELTS